MISDGFIGSHYAAAAVEGDLDGVDCMVATRSSNVSEVTIVVDNLYYKAASDAGQRLN